jgi:hypothetical protein
MGRARDLAAEGNRGRAEAAKQEPGNTSHHHTTQRGENEETCVRGCDVKAVAPARGGDAHQLEVQRPPAVSQTTGEKAMFAASAWWQP